jgi:hypothetical protein
MRGFSFRINAMAGPSKISERLFWALIVLSRGAWKEVIETAFEETRFPSQFSGYCSKSAARVELVKPIAVRNRHGLNRAVERTMP